MIFFIEAQKRLAFFSYEKGHENCSHSPSENWTSHKLEDTKGCLEVAKPHWIQT